MNEQPRIGYNTIPIYSKKGIYETHLQQRRPICSKDHNTGPAEELYREFGLLVCPLEGRHQSLIAKTSRRYELLLRFFQFLKDKFEDLH